jgi:hypothetical protein
MRAAAQAAAVTAAALLTDTGCLQLQHGMFQVQKQQVPESPGRSQQSTTWALATNQQKA